MNCKVDILRAPEKQLPVKLQDFFMSAGSCSFHGQFSVKMHNINCHDQGLNIGSLLPNLKDPFFPHLCLYDAYS